MTGAGVAAASILALTPAAVGASDGRGFVELRLQGFSGVEGQPVQTIQRLRPELSTDLSDRMSLTVGVELGLSQGRSFRNEWRETLRASALGPVLEAAQCDWPEEENSFLRVSRAEDYLSVERLYLDWYLPGADLRLGRQAVHWGSAVVVNPTDPFPEILLLEPWRQRRGVNALRATLPMGEDHDVQMVVGSNDAFDAARVAVRGTVNVGLADISLVGAYRQESENGIVGLDLRGTAVVGYWLEGSAHFDDDHQWSEEVAVGIDYSWPVLDGLLVRAQYYRNGAGETQPSALAPLSDTIEPPTCATGEVPLGVEGEPESADPFAPLPSRPRLRHAHAGPDHRRGPDVQRRGHPEPGRRQRRGGAHAVLGRHRSAGVRRHRADPLLHLGKRWRASSRRCGSRPDHPRPGRADSAWTCAAWCPAPPLSSGVG